MNSTLKHIVLQRNEAKSVNAKGALLALCALILFFAIGLFHEAHPHLVLRILRDLMGILCAAGVIQSILGCAGQVSAEMNYQYLKQKVAGK